MNEKKEVLNVNDELVKDEVSENKESNGLKKPLLVVAIGGAVVAATTLVVKGIKKGAAKAKIKKEEKAVKYLSEQGYTILPPVEVLEQLEDESETTVSESENN